MPRTPTLDVPYSFHRRSPGPSSPTTKSGYMKEAGLLSLRARRLGIAWDRKGWECRSDGGVNADSSMDRCRVNSEDCGVSG